MEQLRSHKFDGHPVAALEFMALDVSNRAQAYELGAWAARHFGLTTDDNPFHSGPYALAFDLAVLEAEQMVEAESQLELPLEDRPAPKVYRETVEDEIALLDPYWQDFKYMGSVLGLLSVCVAIVSYAPF